MVCIFDMDGVISDSEPLHHIAEKKLLQPYGIEMSQQELQGLTGIGTEAMLDLFINRYDLEVSREILLRQHADLLYTLFEKQAVPISGVLDLIFELHRTGFALAVGSSSSGRLIQLVLEKFEILPYFKTWVSGQDVKNSKPHPDIFLEVARRLEVAPQYCAVIEDSRNGVHAAKKADMFCIGFRSPNSPNQDLSAADWIVSDLHEIHVPTLMNTLPGFAGPTGEQTI